MYSGIGLSNRSLLTGRVAGTHQRLDQAAHRVLRKNLKKGIFFPPIKDILRFEGRKGPDGLKLKSPTKDEPSHFIIPNADDGVLIGLIRDHYFGLKHALKNRDNVLSAYHAAWLAHFITDGLTPAHHFPYQDAINELMCEKDFINLFGKPVKCIMRGNSALQFAKNNWKYWGVNGVLSRHVAFEYGVSVMVSTIPYKRYLPEIEKNSLKNFDLETEFYAFFNEINKFNFYGRFGKTGWTPKLITEIEKLLLPAIIRLIMLAWYSAAVWADEERKK